MKNLILALALLVGVSFSTAASAHPRPPFYPPHVGPRPHCRWVNVPVTVRVWVVTPYGGYWAYQTQWQPRLICR